MGEQRIYDLKGLKQIFAGLIIGMVAGAFMGVVANQTMSKELGILSSILNAAGTILLIVSLVMVIKGLGECNKYSFNFGSARKYYILSVAANVALIAFECVVVMKKGFTWFDKGLSDTATANMMIWIMLILCAIQMVFNILTYRGIMFGCSEISISNGNEEMPVKCKKAFKHYAIGTIGTVIAASIMLWVALRIIRSTIGKNIQPEFGLGLVSLIAMLVFGVVCIVAFIQMLNYISTTHKLYDGRPIG